MPNSYFALCHCKWMKAHLGTAGITKTPGSNLKTAVCLGGCKYSLWVLLMKISISARSLRSQSQIAGRLRELSLTQLDGWDTYGGWRQVGLSGPFKPIPDFWMKTHKGILLQITSSLHEGEGSRLCEDKQEVQEDSRQAKPRGETWMNPHGTATNGCGGQGETQFTGNKREEKIPNQF